MTHNCKPIAKSEGCCRRDKNMIKCAATAINQMKMMFDTALCPIKEKPDIRKTKNAGCVLDPVCNIRECPFRGTGVAPNVLQTYCTKTNDRTSGGVSDRDAMRLMPGEVGLRGDRATFSLVRDDGLTNGANSGGGGAVYFNIRPNGNSDQDDELDGDNYATQEQEEEQDQDQEYDRDQDRNADQDQDPDPDHEQDQDQDCLVDVSADQKNRKHVMEILPTVVKPTLGPVTGLPVRDDEHVFVLWLGKRPGEPDEKARLQIEVRVPKRMPEPETPEVTIVEAAPEVSVIPNGKKQGSSKKKGNSKKGGKK